MSSDESTTSLETGPSFSFLSVASGFAAARAWLRPRKARPFYGRHPWVLESAIGRVEGDPQDGDIVDLMSDKDKFLARGIFNAHSRIRVRLYTWEASQPLDDAFWRSSLERAIALRRELGFLNDDGAARLVFSEADGISGLIVDRYGEYLAVQATALAISERLPVLVPILVQLLQPRGVVIRNERDIAKQEGTMAPDGPYWGDAPTGPVFITEHGIRYGLELSTGQKTGFYLDQRDNRRAAAEYLRGRRVLDMFCYSGGFALNAAVHGAATEVVAVDSSERAIALARANAQMNGVSSIQFRVGEGFQMMDELRATGERFGGIVLDPPKFARSRATVNDALRAYHRINRLAVELLEPGGILITCSCSGHVAREDFMWMLSAVAQRTGRDIQVLEQRGASADHCVSATCLEGEYLKCFVCRVGS